MAYGRPDASFEEIESVGHRAGLAPLIEGLSEGYNTAVGERGLKLSGGEKQRVAIARALLKDPEILFYDEATSALDAVTERLILDSMDSVGEGRTSVVIAHRLSTVMMSDNIFVIVRLFVSLFLSLAHVYIFSDRMMGK